MRTSAQAADAGLADLIAAVVPTEEERNALLQQLAVGLTPAQRDRLRKLSRKPQRHHSQPAPPNLDALLDGIRRKHAAAEAAAAAPGKTAAAADEDVAAAGEDAAAADEGAAAAGEDAAAAGEDAAAVGEDAAAANEDRSASDGAEAAGGGFAGGGSETKDAAELAGGGAEAAGEGAEASNEGEPDPDALPFSPGDEWWDAASPRPSPSPAAAPVRTRVLRRVIAAARAARNAAGSLKHVFDTGGAHAASENLIVLAALGTVISLVLFCCCGGCARRRGRMPAAGGGGGGGGSAATAATFSPARQDVEGGVVGDELEEDAFSADGETLLQQLEGLLMRLGILGKGATPQRNMLKRAINPAKVS